MVCVFLLLIAFTQAQSGYDPDKCQSLDVMVLIDTSESISPDNLSTEKTFARQLVDTLLESHSKTHIGVVSFGPVITQVPLGAHSNTVLDSAINGIFHDRDFFGQIQGQTPTHRALESAGYEFQVSGRKDVARVVFLITDGAPNDPQSAMDVAKDLKRSGVNVVTIGIALAKSQADIDSQPQVQQAIFENPELRDYYKVDYFMSEMASEPASLFFHSITNFNSLQLALPSITSQTCSYVDAVAPACGPVGTKLTVKGYHLYNTKSLRVFFDFGPALGVRKVAATWVSDEEVFVIIPEQGFPTLTNESDRFVATVEVSLDGTAVTTTNRQQYQFRLANDISPCFSAVGVFDRVPVASAEEDSLWWLGLLIPLLLLCFLLPLFVYVKKKPKKEKAPVPTEEPDQIELEKPLPEEAHLVQSADADAAKPASSPPKKWKVVSSAYIGYGKGKMDVDWAGDAPASAPHALKRFQVQEGASAVAGQAHNEEDGELHNVSLDVSPGEMHAGFSTQDEYERYSCAQLVFGCACFKKKKKKKDLAAKSGAFVPTQPKQSKALKAQAAAEQTEEEQRASRASATAAIAAALRSKHTVCVCVCVLVSQRRESKFQGRQGGGMTTYAQHSLGE